LQEAAKHTGATGARDRTGNTFYNAVLTIQNAANLQWPERNPANAAVRAEFLLGSFPPRSAGSDKKSEPPKPPAPPA